MAKSKSGEVVVASTTSIIIPTSAEQIPAVIEQLKATLKELQGDTDKEISLEISLGGKKVKDYDKVSDLLELSARLHAMQTAYDEEIERYNLGKLNIKKWSIEGVGIKHVEKVIDKGIRTLVNKKQIEKIQNSIDKLSQHLSAEERLKADLASIMGTAAEEIA